MATLFAQLKPAADAHLTAFHADFDTHDKRTLRMSLPGDVYIFVVRPTGTHLCLIEWREDVRPDLTPGHAVDAWDVLDALRDMPEVRAVRRVEVQEPRHGTVTALDTIPPRPRSLDGVKGAWRGFS